MKTLTKYLNEKLIIFPSQVDEKLVINKDYKDAYTCAPASWEELRKIIEDRYDKFGPGTKQKPIDFNDVDVSNIDSFYDDNNYVGVFRKTKFKYIDISYWDVSNVNCMIGMFSECEQLKSVGNLSNWDVSSVKNMLAMFADCINLKSVGDLSNWDVSKVKYMDNMFINCHNLKSVGDLSNWDVSKVKNKDMDNMFYRSGITNIPDWYRR